MQLLVDEKTEGQTQGSPIFIQTTNGRGCITSRKEEGKRRGRRREEMDVAGFILILISLFFSFYLYVQE